MACARPFVPAQGTKTDFDDLAPCGGLPASCNGRAPLRLQKHISNLHEKAARTFANVQKQRVVPNGYILRGSCSIRTCFADYLFEKCAHRKKQSRPVELHWPQFHKHKNRGAANIGNRTSEQLGNKSPWCFAMTSKHVNANDYWFCIMEILYGNRGGRI